MAVASKAVASEVDALYDRDILDLEKEEAEDRLFIGGIEKSRQVRNQYSAREKRRRALIITGSILGGLLLLGLIIGLAVGLKRRKISYTCPATNGRFDIVFFVVGDWGRGGNSNQRTVARMMGEVGACMQPAFVISTGDNFYENGLKAANDPTFTSTFTDVYTAPSLQVPWYAVLGNHDYGELSSYQYTTCSAPSLAQCASSACCYSPLWQTGPGPNVSALDVRWHASQGVWKRTFLGGKLDVVFMDTNPYIDKYWDAVWANTPGGITTQRAANEANRDALVVALANSTAQWKLLVGHHPVHSYGAHCDGNPRLGDCSYMQWLRQYLRLYNVSTYLCGHDHDLQLIKMADVDDPAYYVVSGAGSDVRSGEFSKVEPSDETDFFADQSGFVAVGIKGNIMTLFYYTSRQSSPAYSVDITR